MLAQSRLLKTTPEKRSLMTCDREADTKRGAQNWPPGRLVPSDTLTLIVLAAANSSAHAVVVCSFTDSEEQTLKALRGVLLPVIGSGDSPRSRMDWWEG
jgi:hypothetical protein